jgi:hypothetical protein
MERKEVRAIADTWPEILASFDDVMAAVGNAVNNLLGYPHGEDAAWSRWISIDRQQLNELFSRMRR